MFDSHKKHTLCPSFLVALSIFSVFTLAGIVSAAWVDAPNGPPNYGVTGCAYPCLEADFKPMNLSATNQTKQGNISASGFFDTQDPAYFIDPQSPLFAANLSGHTVINGNSSVLGAQLVVNNPKNLAKTGAAGDAIYTYASSTNAALSAEQGNPAGYSIYASGGVNYFQQSVGIGTATPGVILEARAPTTGAVNTILRGRSNDGTKIIDVNIQNDGTANFGGTFTNFGIGTTSPTNKVSVVGGVDISGNVGIGTATPQEKLHVVGDIRVDGTITTSASTSFSKYMQIKSGTGIYYLPLYYGAPPSSGTACYQVAGCKTYSGTPALQSQIGSTAYYSTPQFGTGCCGGNQQGYQFNSQYNMETQTWVSSCSLQINFQQGC